VPVASIRAWEQGRRHPSGPALTLLHLLERDPATMTRLLREKT
jgi:DNA-binding transcriptional regulator YiaG